MNTIALTHHSHIKSMSFLLLALATFIIFAPNAFAQTGGSWQKQDIKVSGSWNIEKRADGHYIVLNDQFKTRGAPDLKLFLSKNNYGSITGRNATNNATFIAKLRSNKGAQSYKIPANINVSDYQSLIIHCEQYSKLWASTSLR